MRTARLVVALVAAVGLNLAGASLAQADTQIRRDARGDGPASIDITRARYSYGDGRVRVVARIPDLGRAGDASLSISRFGIFEAGYVVRVTKRIGERPRVRLYFFDHFDTRRRPCDRMLGRWNDRSIRIGVSTACLKGHARRRAFVQFGIRRGQSIDRAPAVRRLARD